MKKILLLLLVCSVSSSYAQTNNHIATNNFNTFNATDILKAEVSYDMPRTTAYGSAPCMNGYIVGSYIFGFAGGALIGWPLGTAIAGGDPDWYLAGIGAGLAGVAIVFEVLGKKRCNGYALNQGSQSEYTVKNKGQIKLVSGGSNVGLALSL